MVHFLWSARHQKKSSSGSLGNSRERRVRPRLRTSFRLIAGARYVEFVFLTSSSTNVKAAPHRFEKIIAGRHYLIEVASVADRRWRAHIVRIPGVPTALMPFYGTTPDEAAGNLTDWLDRAYRQKANTV
jgi:hypothetical protein